MARTNHLFRRGRLVCAGLAVAVAAAMLSGAAAATAASAPARAHGLLSMRLKLGGGSGPAAVATLGVPTTGLDTLQASLNGHPVALPPVAGSGARRVLNLAELGRLRFGTNRLRVRLVMTDGAVQAVSRKFTLSGHRDIAAARVLAPATTGHTATLDAGRSLLVPGTGGLATARWTLVRRPARSRARLGSASGARVTLRPDVPGHYLIALRVGTGLATGVDLLNEAVTYPEPLVPFNTIAQDHAVAPNPGIQIENSFNVDPKSAGEYGTLQMLVLDRTTLAPVYNQGYNGTDGIATAAKALADMFNTPDYLVIITHPGPEYGIPAIPASSSDLLESLVGMIGGTVAAQWQFGRSDCWSGGTDLCNGNDAAWKRNAMYGGSFTYIGVPGMPAGQAWRETAVQLGAPDGNGPITGYFTRGTLADGGTNNYTVVAGPNPYVPVQTCTTAGCDVQVGEHSYAPDAGTSNGMHVVVLDRTTLNLITNTTVTTPGQLDTALQSSQPPAVGHYNGPTGGMVDDQRVVIIQSIGTGKLSGTVPASLLARINQFGGTPDYLWYAMGPGPTCRYALIGTATDLPWQGTAAESSRAMKYGDTSATGPNCSLANGLPTGQLDGVLQRDRDGLYTPGPANPSGIADNSLYQILYSPGWYQPDQAWPMEDDVTGLEYVADQLGLCDPSGYPCYPDVRSAYSDTGIDFSSKGNKLATLSDNCDPSVCGDHFAELKAELVDEFDWVVNVRTLRDNLKAPYEASNPYFSVQAVTNNVLETVPVPHNNSATMQWLKVFSGVMGVGQGIAKLAGSDPASAVFGVLSAAGNIATGLLTPSSGGQADSVTAAADDLADAIYQQQLAYIEWTGQAAKILVSTYQQLHAAGVKIWSFPSDATDEVEALGGSAAAAAYSALVPVAWDGYNLKPGVNLPGSDDVSTYSCAEVSLTGHPAIQSQPFNPSQPANRYPALSSVDNSGKPVFQVWTFANTSGFEDGQTPSATMPGNTVTGLPLSDYIYGPDATAVVGKYYGAFQFEASWWRSTYNPPSHTICNQLNVSPTPPTRPWSTALSPPAIQPPPA
jgi:hypothetical protein